MSRPTEQRTGRRAAWAGRVPAWLLLVAAFLSLGASLGGCAAGAGAPGALTVAVPAAGSADLPTPSDESEARRRSRVRLALAVGYFEQGQTTVALDELKQVLAADPGFAEAHNLRGLVYLRLNDLRVAEESFRRALALNPRDGATLHNYGWLLCQQQRYALAQQAFEQALASPLYADHARTLLAQGVCLARAGQLAEAERCLTRAYELDAGNPVTGYNLAALLYQRGDFDRARFYIQRINGDGDLANAETLWLGARVEHRLGNRDAMQALADQLRRRWPRSREFASYERGAFDE